MVTGLGAVTPIGNDLSTTWQALIAGRSGIRHVTRFDATAFKGAIAGEVCDFEPGALLPARRMRMLDWSAQMGLAAAAEAIADAGLPDEPLGPRAGVVFGSTFGGSSLLEDQLAALETHGPRRVSPFFLTGVLPDAMSGHIAIQTGATGPNMAVLAASATGAGAIGEAAEIIKRGDADTVIAGACEAPLTPFLYAGFTAMRGMAVAESDPAGACRPFDAMRSGFVVAEGAGAFVLESLDRARERGARIYADVSGYGSANDAYHMTAEDPEGRGLAAAIAMALR